MENTEVVELIAESIRCANMVLEGLKKGQPNPLFAGRPDPSKFNIQAGIEILESLKQGRINLIRIRGRTTEENIESLTQADIIMDEAILKLEEMICYANK